VIRVTADSNIYISALHFGGPPDKFLDLARTGIIELTISDDILAEVTRVLRDKFGWSREALSMAQARIADFTVRVAPTQKLDAVREDPADNRARQFLRDAHYGCLPRICNASPRTSASRSLNSTNASSSSLSDSCKSPSLLRSMSS
jgi:hypothetical protein